MIKANALKIGFKIYRLNKRKSIMHAQISKSLGSSIEIQAQMCKLCDASGDANLHRKSFNTTIIWDEAQFLPSAEWYFLHYFVNVCTFDTTFQLMLFQAHNKKGEIILVYILMSLLLNITWKLKQKVNNYETVHSWSSSRDWNSNPSETQFKSHDKVNIRDFIIPLFPRHSCIMQTTHRIQVAPPSFLNLFVVFISKCSNDLTGRVK